MVQFDTLVCIVGYCHNFSWKSWLHLEALLDGDTRELISPAMNGCEINVCAVRHVKHAKPSAVFQDPKKVAIWNFLGGTIQTYNLYVVSYGSETRIYIKSVRNVRNAFERWCYQRMSSWVEHVADDEVFNKTSTNPSSMIYSFRGDWLFKII